MHTYKTHDIIYTQITSYTHEFIHKYITMSKFDSLILSVS
jgi:hypothetical protein